MNNIGIAAAFAVIPILTCAAASVAPRMESLTTPAATVRRPDKVVLIALVNAGARVLAAGEHGVIIYSDDNGKSWTQARVPVDLTLTSMEFASPRIGWAAGHYGTVLHTADGGRTWQLQLDGIYANQLTAAAATAAQAAHDPSPAVPLAALRAAHFVAGGPDKPMLSLLAQSPSNVTAFGAYRMVMHSDDGGRTWTDWSLRIGDRLSHNLYDAVLVGGDICVAAEAGNVFCSTNGGASFPAVTSPGPATLLGLVAIGDGGMLGFGVAGLADRSMDGGKTWVSVNLGTQSNLTCGHVLKSGAILIGGEDGSLYASIDHGRNFRALNRIEPMAIFDLTEASNGDIVIAGSGGAMTVPRALLSLN